MSTISLMMLRRSSPTEEHSFKQILQSQLFSKHDEAQCHVGLVAQSSSFNPDHVLPRARGKAKTWIEAAYFGRGRVD